MTKCHPRHLSFFFPVPLSVLPVISPSPLSFPYSSCPHQTVAPRSDGDNRESVRLLTNNLDKVEALELEEEGLRVMERVLMVPKSSVDRSSTTSRFGDDSPTRNGGQCCFWLVFLTRCLDKYLRTKIILRMGYILPLLRCRAVSESSSTPSYFNIAIFSLFVRQIL